MTLTNSMCPIASSALTILEKFVVMHFSFFRKPKGRDYLNSVFRSQNFFESFTELNHDGNLINKFVTESFKANSMYRFLQKYTCKLQSNTAPRKLKSNGFARGGLLSDSSSEDSQGSFSKANRND